jgi:D-3-phosphoglycerate dehydrogenase
MSLKVLLPDNMGHNGIEVLRGRGDINVAIYPAAIPQAELLPMLADAAAIALSGTPFGRTELDASRVIQLVARLGVGYDSVDVPALTARRIPLMVTGTANSTAVAEQALAMMLALAKQHAVMDRIVRRGAWDDRFVALPSELADKTVLIVGFGRIGTRTAKRCLAFEMTVLVFDPYQDHGRIIAAGCEPVGDLDAAVARADFVSIHCPKSPETIGLFDAARLARARRGAVIVNTARGGIVDETALYAALISGQIAGAGLDVFTDEPTPANNSLLTLETVIASPHIAGVTAEAVAAMAQVTALNILSVLDGAPNRDSVINVEVLY